MGDLYKVNFEDMGGVISSQTGQAYTQTDPQIWFVDAIFMPALLMGSKIVVTFNNRIISGGASGSYPWCYSLDGGTTIVQVANGQSAILDLYGVSHIKIGVYNNGNNYQIEYYYTIETI